MVLDFNGYKCQQLREKYRRIDFAQSTQLLDFQKQLTPKHRTPIQPTTSSAVPPYSTPSTNAPRNTSSISRIMLSHKFYPERRPGHGPKRVRDDLDRTFSISSTKMIEALKLRKDKQAGKRKIGTKRRGINKTRKNLTNKRQKTTASSSSSIPSQSILSSSSEENSENEGINEQDISIHDTSDDSIDIGPINYSIRVPLQEPREGSWIGIKVQKLVKSKKGRNITPFEVYIGKVKEIDEEGQFKVCFVREKNNAFYYDPEEEEISYPVMRQEIVSLDEPSYETKFRISGYQFPSKVLDDIRNYFHGKDTN